MRHPIFRDGVFYVVGSRSDKKMTGIKAGWIVAFVANIMFTPDRLAHPKVSRQSMHEHGTSMKTNSAVAVCIPSALPIPASADLVQPHVSEQRDPFRHLQRPRGLGECLESQRQY